MYCLTSASSSVITLPCEFRVHRAGSQLKSRSGTFSFCTTLARLTSRGTPADKTNANQTNMAPFNNGWRVTVISPLIGRHFFVYKATLLHQYGDEINSFYFIFGPEMESRPVGALSGQCLTGEKILFQYYQDCLWDIGVRLPPKGLILFTPKTLPL